MRQFEEQFPPLLEIRQVYRALGSYFQLACRSGAMTSFDFDLLDFAHRFNFSPTRVLSSLRILEESGWLSLSESVFQPATLWLTSGPPGPVSVPAQEPEDRSFDQDGTATVSGAVPISRGHSAHSDHAGVGIFRKSRSPVYWFLPPIQCPGIPPQCGKTSVAV